MKIEAIEVIINGKKIEVTEFAFSCLQTVECFVLKKTKENLEWFNKFKEKDFHIDSFYMRDGNRSIVSGKGKIEVLNETDEHYELLVLEYI